ncbi:MAG: chromosome segregation protein SMC [Gammaproteobacteria bacterium]|nr:chromosome segregation protein SMC [Gammaproteobacteria bacterium]
MRLKKIKLAGFKSFVDPTTISMPSALIGVVGPNGCGKSNVIDAVRWVMGESSAKNLRGDSSSDVIFNGSSSRKPVGHAMIELVFDNSEGRLGGEYAQYNEISIKRQLSRDGQSIYMLNGVRCRRRDITDIFLGTGLGPRSYAIIQQGTVSRLIEAKPEELRVYLEEVAGIARYKDRRRETESRIRSSKENIDRITDIITELEKRLQTLQRQARTAEKYKELKQEEKLLRAQLLVLRWSQLNAELSGREGEIRSREVALESQIAELRAVEAETERQREVHIEASELFNQVQARFYSSGAEIGRLEQGIQHASEQRQHNSDALAEAISSTDELRVQLQRDQQCIDELQGTLASSTPDREAAEQAEQWSAAALREAEQQMLAWQQEWDEFNSQAAREMRQAEVEQTRVVHLEDQLQRLRARLQRLEDERQQMSDQTLEVETRTLREQFDLLTASSGDISAALQQLLARISGQRDSNHGLNDRLNAARHHAHELQRRHASLEALQQAALGKHEGGAVGDWLEAHGYQDRQRLAERLDVDAGWERAVETVLGQNLEAVCVEDLGAVANELAALGQGTLTLFDTSIKDGAVHAGATSARLSDRVRAPWSLTSLFDGIRSAESLADAMQQRHTLADGESIVTRDGIWIGHNWMRVVRPSDAKGGILVREQELKQLATEYSHAAQQVEDLEQQLQAGQAGLRALEQEREVVQQRLNETARQHGEVRADLGRKEARLEELRSRMRRLDEESDELRTQLASHGEDLIQVRNRLEAALAVTAQHETLRATLVAKRDQLRQSLESTRDQARQDRDRAREFALRIEGIRQQLAALQHGFDRMQQQQHQLEQRRATLQRSLADGEAPLADMKARLEALLNDRLAIESELGQARNAVESCDNLLRELNTRRNEIEHVAQELRSGLDQFRMQWQESKVRCQTLQEQIDSSGFEREALIRELPEGANEPEWQQRVDAQFQKIERLGAINLAAIEEYAEEQERKAYLDSQSADLLEALATLESAIRKIDNETRTRFKETYEKVNDKLKEFFPRLFGGGVAHLEMTSDNLLETGIAIVARPPGKRNSSIHQLSGGEKALTAVALVFALFELNPSPFCMLDEVDAPLDDTNAGRFCSLVREMSSRVQFIFITHNKITMELADQLIGVTMHEPGVSRTVAVDVDEAVQMAEAS